MNRVVKRTWLMGLFIFVLLCGMGVFAVEYVAGASTWIGSPGSTYMHSDAIGYGAVQDRGGELLLSVGESKSYHADPIVRSATMHWLGDRQGNIASRAISGYAGAMSGYDVLNGVYDFSGRGGQMMLTLSAPVQKAALEALDGRKGTVAVYNYKTGQILCAVTSPTYDPDQIPDVSGPQYEGVYLNRFVQSAYVPGSIFKVVTAAAALECVPDILERRFTCTGELAFGEEAVTCERAHGTQDLRAALANSCNCAFAQIAELVGKKNMTAFVEEYQLTEPVSFDNITTARGNYDVSQTAPVSFAWSCIGQYTDLINPCRFMTLMGSIAAGGVGAEPYLVEQVSAGAEVTYQAQTRLGQRTVSRETAAILGEYLRNNVQIIYGAQNFPDLTVCAKSGTSELGGGLTSNAMFAGFVADEEYPLAFIVVVENGGYGASACVPVLSKVLAQCKTELDRE